MKYYKFPIESTYFRWTETILRVEPSGHWCFLHYNHWYEYDHTTISAKIYNNLDRYELSEDDVEAEQMLELL